MNKAMPIIKKVLLWIFVVSCLLMAIGCGSAAGAILFLITAVIAAPLKIFGDLWNKILGIREIQAPSEEIPAKWYERQKKKEQKQYKNAVEIQKGRKMLKPMIIILTFMISFSVALANTETSSNTGSEIQNADMEEVVNDAMQDIPEPTVTLASTTEPEEKETLLPSAETKETAIPNPTVMPTPTAEPTPEVVAEISSSFNLSHIPAYSGPPYVTVNNNIPYFAETEMSTESYEYYSDLDSQGRCGVCVACIGRDLMPDGERGEIGSIKPTGWHTVKYNGVIDGNYLYNRCHLIGWQLTGENANTKNLITGTRYMNVQGMLPFENMVADYVKETGNHVMYRVTPIFDGKNLLASGVLMEAKSVEDDGKGVLFNVYCYNVQPDIMIDYETGDSSLDETKQVITETEPTPKPEQTQTVITPEPTQQEQTPVAGGSYAVNGKNGKIHIVGSCPATGTGDHAMTNPVYFNTYEEAEAYSISIKPGLEKRQCGNCW